MTTTDEGSTILIVEDDALVRDGVASSLRSLGYTVRAMVDGTDLDDVLAEFEPDLALVDVNLPQGPNGFEIAERIRAVSTTAVVFITARDDLDDRIRGFDVGADDYVVKPFSSRELAARVRAVLRRVRGNQQSSTLAVADVVVDVSRRHVERAGATLALTPTEFDLLHALMKQPGEPRSKRDLLEEVWGYRENSPHLVEVQISGLRRKLEALGPRIIVTCRGGAYMVTP